MYTGNIVLEQEYDDQRHSNFIDTLAWIFIVLVGLVTLISMFQNILVSLVFPFNEMHTALARAGQTKAVPWLATFMLEHFRLLSLMFLLVSAATLASAIGLLKRKNWARVAFIWIMGLGIFWNVVRIALPLLMFFTLASATGTASDDFGYQFDVVQKIMIAFSVLIAVGLSVLFGWIVKCLASAEVKREFFDGEDANWAIEGQRRFLN